MAYRSIFADHALGLGANHFAGLGDDRVSDRVRDKTGLAACDRSLRIVFYPANFVWNRHVRKPEANLLHGTD